MRISLTCMAVALFTVGTAYAADSVVPVFGLPLGGKMPRTKICTVDEISAHKRKAHCWVDKPFVAKDGGKLGSLNMADPDALPSWAVHASFSVSLSPTGTVERVRVESRGSDDKQAIASSISQRFGLPVSTTLPRTDLAEATWLSQGIGIFQRCVRERCEVNFLSAAELAEQRRTADKAKEVDARRPATP